MGTSKTCLLFISLQLFSIVTAQEYDKRVPQGFVGMRGKKYLEDETTEQFYKRKPQFFVGVKGKKTPFDFLGSPIKRTPTGFMGMRGKKDISDDFYDRSFEFMPKRDGSLIGQIDYASGEGKANNFPFLNEILSSYLRKLEIPNSIEESSEEMRNEIEKRAANIHQFFGVRGKKSIEDIKRPYDVTFRGKFIGVRGKKDLKNTNAQEVKFLLDNGPLLKRKGQMGFIGMRGKKWMETDGENDTSSELETSE